MTTVTVGEVIARMLEAHQVKSVYGVISIHNLPIADAIGRRNKVRFVCARGEAGSVAMADAEARYDGLGVALTSTGAGSGNAVGALIEAYNAGSPVLHITGQVEREYLDRDASFIHEAKDQLGYLSAASKAAFRITSPEHTVGVMREAIRAAQALPKGPVSVEIPVDVQAAQVQLPADLGPIDMGQPPLATDAEIDAAVKALAGAKRPMLWIGGGCIESSAEVQALADLGIPVVSSTHARGVLADDHPRSLGAFHNQPAVEELITNADALLVVGSRLRSNETKTYSLKFPEQTIQVDVSPMAQQRNYEVSRFICAESKDFLQRLLAAVDGLDWIDHKYDQQILDAKQAAVAALSQQLGPYADLCFALREAMPQDSILVRDITMSGSTWGSRLYPVQKPNQNIHSLAGAIGLGLPQAIGVARANPGKKVLALVGDGGLMLNIGEIATMVQEKLPIILMVMNDRGYGVMRGIQRNHFEDRQYFNELTTPDFVALGESMGCLGLKADSIESFKAAIAQAVQADGPVVLEVDMQGIGPLNFAGPPQKKLY